MCQWQLQWLNNSIWIIHLCHPNNAQLQSSEVVWRCWCSSTLGLHAEPAAFGASQLPNQGTDANSRHSTSGHIWTYLDMIEYWTILNMPDFKTLALWYLARNVQTAKSVICEVYRDLERRCHEVCLVLWQSLVNISCRVLLPRCWQERRQYEESGRAPIDLNLNFRKLSQRQMRQCVRHTAIATKT